MMYGDCFSGNWDSLFGGFGFWGWVGLILNLIFWGGLIAGVVMLVIWAIRRARVSAATGSYATGQPTAKDILQARYARGDLTREQYELKKQVIG
jgi:putative membrane protein